MTICLETLFSGDAGWINPACLQTRPAISVQLPGRGDKTETRRKRENRPGDGNSRVTETDGDRAMFDLCKYQDNNNK